MASLHEPERVVPERVEAPVQAPPKRRPGGLRREGTRGYARRRSPEARRRALI